MPIPDASRDDVLAAMDLFDSEQRNSDAWTNWEAKENYRFAVVRDGRRYPVKQIVAHASGISRREFSGGEEANGWLRRRGFEVIELRSDREGSNPLPSWWWVNQGATYEQERAGGYLWAPKQGKAGYAFGHWTNMAKLQVGDLVVHYANSAIRAIGVVQEPAIDAPRPAELPTETWQEAGYFTRIEYFPLTTLISLREIPAEWRYSGAGPFTQDGGVKQGYLFPLTTDFATHLVERFGDRLPTVARNWQEGHDGGESAAVAAVRDMVERLYPDAAVRTQCLTVLADGIERAHAVSPMSWGVSMLQGRSDLRLNVLWTQPCILRANELYLVVDRHSVPDDAREGFEAAFADDPRNGPVYPTMTYASAYGVRLVQDRLEELLPLVREPNQRFIELCAGRVKSRAHRFGEHVPAIVDYLRRELGREIPQPGTPPSPPAERSMWLFQANPRVWNLAEELQHRSVGDDATWVVSRFQEQMQPGDAVILWQGGSEAGIYALGELVDVPFVRPTSEFFPDHEQRPPDEWAVPFVYTAIVAPPLLRSELQAHPVLKDLSVIRGPQGTNFKVTAEQWQALQDLLAAQIPQSAPRWWIEKTNSQRWSYRTRGDEFAVGRALVAPAHSNTGADLYRNVRLTQVGDVILHFTDQTAFTGWSRVAGPFTETDTRPDFAIGPEHMLVVPLTDYHPIEPPLSRTKLFNPPYAERLQQLLGTGPNETFFSAGRQFRLKTSAYLTPASPELVAVLKDAYLGLTGRTLGPTDVAVAPVDEPVPPLPPPDYVEPSFAAIVDAIRAQGMRIDERAIRRYHLALRTRGFVVLSGLSGTGKTWLAEAYARAVGARHAVVAVAPNWTTNEDLLGYLNPLTEEYHHTAFSRFVHEAGEAFQAAEQDGVRAQPYHLVLDEMNLARVEYYFAQFLSAMEVRARHGSATIDLGTDEPLLLPPNLVVIGTVNVDETTHGFADKVYDRAQLIELEARREDLVAHFAGTPYEADVMAMWDAVHHVGPFTFRVLDEMRAYVDAAVVMGAPWEEALDEQLLQKVLPKLKGADPRVGDALMQVVTMSEERFPLCSAKAAAMLEGFRSHGFASYFG